MRIVLYPYKMYSKSSKALSSYLKNNCDYRIIKVYSDRNYTYRNGDIVINWGNAIVPRWDYSSIINSPLSVQIAKNKLSTFQKLQEHGIRTVEFTTNPQEAMEWEDIVERHLLESCGGKGIRFSKPDTISRAKLYTRLLNPTEEYRVHVFDGEIIDYSKKVKRGDGSDLIKSHDNGWYFIREVRPRDGLIEMAKNVINAIGLDFGAVDIIRHDGKRYVLEVNTAVGLSEIGVKAYGDAIINIATHGKKTRRDTREDQIPIASGGRDF